MKFTIVVHAAPYSRQAARSALYFTLAALEKQHEIYRLFSFLMEYTTRLRWL